MKIIDIIIEFGLFILIVVVIVSRFVYAPLKRLYEAQSNRKNVREHLKLLEHDYGIKF